MDDLNAKLAADLTNAANKKEEAAKVTGSLLVELGSDLESTGDFVKGNYKFLQALKNVSPATLITIGMGAIGLATAAFAYYFH